MLLFTNSKTEVVKKTTVLMITLCYLVKEKQHNELNFLLLKKKTLQENVYSKMMQKIMAQQKKVHS